MIERTKLEIPVLGIEPVDRAHQELMDSMRQLELADDLEFSRGFPIMVARVEQDFRDEEALMQDLALESYPAHIEQHARLLSALHHTASAVMQDDLETGREAVSLFLNWFGFHIATMDKALATALRINNSSAAAGSVPSPN